LQCLSGDGLTPILRGAKCSPSLRAKRSNPDARQEDWIASSQVLLAMTALLRQRELISAHHEGVELVAFRVPEIGSVKSALAARTGRAFVGATQRQRELVDAIDLGPVLGGQRHHHAVPDRHRLAVEPLGSPQGPAPPPPAPGTKTRG